ncbi:MAG: hypothetical protein RJB09_1398, partial [Pseudomonadota bacterium]
MAQQKAWLHHIRPLAWAAALLGAGVQTAAAQPAADFYKGKTMTIVVGASVGGGVDLFARLVSR